MEYLFGYINEYRILYISVTHFSVWVGGISVPFGGPAYMSYTLVTNVRNPRQCLTKVKAQVHPTGASIDAPLANSMPINSKSTLW